ncbi:transmembrane protein 134 isoform X2 [Oryx dammah]|uniref:transmembrane protein 134 isoform X2 n=1 Tax=Oryx dammah TaxID=59534 RepID=UPI001A9AC3E2|nr:transmembrane protein 134 isoform X2 [Oryx dammah]
MTPSSCPWRTRALGSSPAGSPASGRCTSSAGPGSRWPTRTSSPGCATRDSGRTSIRSSQWSFSSISSSTQRSYNACCSWTQHPLIQKNHRVVLASFLLLLLGLVLILTGVGLEVAPSPGERPLRPLQAALTPHLGPGVLAKPFHFLQRSAPSQQETAPVTTERETRPSTEPAREPPCPDPTPPPLPQVSPAPSSSCRASCCWSQESTT